MHSLHNNQHVIHCTNSVIEIMVEHAANNLKQKAAELKAEYISKKNIIWLNFLIHKYAGLQHACPKSGYMKDYYQKTNYLQLSLQIKEMILKSKKLIDIVPKQLSLGLQKSVSLALKTKAEEYCSTIKGLKIICTDYGETVTLTENEMSELIYSVYGREGPGTEITNNANLFELKPKDK